MSKLTKEQNQLLIIADAMADDVLSMSDEEIITESQESSSNFDSHLSSLQAAISKGVTNSKKARLLAAKRAVQADREQPGSNTNVVGFDLAKARQKIAALVNHSDTARDNILLAARNAKSSLDELPEDELRTLLDDMKELGLLNDEE